MKEKLGEIESIFSYQHFTFTIINIFLHEKKYFLS